MSELMPRDLQRMQYHQGQMLRSQDFRDMALNEAHLRWWHNRALHRPYGIVHGFGIKLAGNFMNVFPDVARGLPGVAYDAYGRELILTREQEIQIPPHEDPCRLCDRRLYIDPSALDQERRLAIPQHRETIVLLVRYAGHDTACGKPEPIEHCWPRHVTGAEGLEFVWCLEEESSYRDGVRVARLSKEEVEALGQEPAAFFSMKPAATAGPLVVRSSTAEIIFSGVMSEKQRDEFLAKVEFKDPQLQTAIKALYRRSQPDYGRRTARAQSRPHILSGTTIPRATPWTVWDPPEALRLRGVALGFQVQIDTSAGGFTGVPCYFATLQRETEASQTETEVGPLIFDGAGDPIAFLTFHTHIDEPARTEFTCRLLIVAQALGDREVNALRRSIRELVRKGPLYVSWLAVQPTTGG
ncbi:MAG: hypothetical protein JXA93_04260 [Anaerolineae bacterium]|nr:hypothetical protein [Anaerolineae bacterium]